MDDHGNSVASTLYALVTAAGNSDECPIVYSEDLDAFFFRDGSFAFDREQGVSWLAKWLGLEQ